MFGAARLTQTGMAPVSTATLWTIIDPEVVVGDSVWRGYYSDASTGYDFVETFGKPLPNDLAVLVQKSEAASGTPATLPLPTDYTETVSTVSNNVSGYNGRLTTYLHKFTGSSDLVKVDNIVQNGNDSQGLVFRPNGIYSEIVVGDVKHVVKRSGEGDLSSTVSAASQVGPLIVVAAFARDAGSPSTTSSVATSLFNGAEIDLRFREYAAGSTGEDITFSMTNGGNVSMMTTFWIKLNR